MVCFMWEFAVSGDLFAWVVLPSLIFLARICDVSLGTLRVIFISRGFKRVAPFVGFFEVIIWLLAIGQVMQNVGNVASYIAYGGGFAAGTYVGMAVEERLSLGNVVIRVITQKDAGQLAEALRKMDVGVTTLDAAGATGPVTILLSVCRRQDLPRVLSCINRYHPSSFYTVEEVRTVKEGIFPRGRGGIHINWRDPHGFFRKGK
ncbi:MAG: DUF2179 domain-containing protein [Methanolinea sp.]|nr:DUF2179 domain-containing protein [Methanolinea sp.]